MRGSDVDNKLVTDLLYITLLPQKSYPPQGKMDEQRELDELTRTVTEQQTKLAETMEEMKLKAARLQEKLDRKVELSKTNAELGIKRVALEYEVVELSTQMPQNAAFVGRPTLQQQAADNNYQAFRELEKAKLNELGELGWTLQSITQFPRPQNYAMNMFYYFSRPL